MRLMKAICQWLGTKRLLIFFSFFLLIVFYPEMSWKTFLSNPPTILSRLGRLPTRSRLFFLSFHHQTHKITHLVPDRIRKNLISFMCSSVLLRYRLFPFAWFLWETKQNKKITVEKHRMDERKLEHRKALFSLSHFPHASSLCCWLRATWLCTI